MGSRAGPGHRTSRAADSPDDRSRAEAVAAAARIRADRAGLRLPDDLLIWELIAGAAGRLGDDGGLGAPGGLGDHGGLGDDADDLAAVLEAATPPEARRANGLHVTPRRLAAVLVDKALAIGPPSAGEGGTDGLPAICDPACGGGAFLLAAAEALHRRGVPRARVVRQCLWGADIDPVGLAAAEAALAVWSGTRPPDGRLVVADALSTPDPWSDRPGAGFDAVVGNPPFLSQLASATARSAAERRSVRQRFGEAARPYADAAWLFLLAGVELTRPGGRVALVQPASIVSARDAGVIRDELARTAVLRDLWVEPRRMFAAAVRVCCPVLEVGGGEAGSASWADRFADKVGVPRVRPAGRETVGDRADVGAGFRGEYYGLVPLVREARPGEAPTTGVDPGQVRARPLVTAGALDWGRNRWGERPIRFARRHWERPVVDLDGVSPDAPRSTPAGKAASWLARTARPKVMVANQTRVVEPVVDSSGVWVPSVPMIAALPHDLDEVWLLAAALASPTATAWLVRRAPGTALARHAVRLTAGDVAALPLPSDRDAWTAGAAAFRALTDHLDGVAHPPQRGERPAALFATYCEQMARAYDARPEVEGWWRSRYPGF